MKKLMLCLAVVVVLVVGGVVFLASNLNGIAGDLMESAGSDALGTQVSVGEVDIDLMGGTAIIHDFSVANPEGFSDEDMLRFDELAVSLDLRSLTGERIHVNSITSASPYVLYEMRDGRANLDVVRERLAGAAPEQEPATEQAPPQLAIDRLEVSDIQGAVRDPRLSRDVDVNLGDITLSDMEGTPSEIAMQIARPLINQLARNAAAVAAQRVTQELRQRAGERVEEEVNERLNEVGEGLGERLGEALNRNQGASE